MTEHLLALWVESEWKARKQALRCVSIGWFHIVFVQLQPLLVWKNPFSFTPYISSFVDNVVSVGNNESNGIDHNLKHFRESYYYVRFWSRLLPRYICLLTLNTWTRFKNLPISHIGENLFTYLFLFFFFSLFLFLTTEKSTLLTSTSTY